MLNLALSIVGAFRSSQSTSIVPLPILNLPEVVISNILKFLPPKSCLRLRLVCKTTKEWISGRSLSNNELRKWSHIKIRITGKPGRSFANAARIKLPLSNFYIVNEQLKEKIYGTEGVLEFVEVYKHRPIQLHVEFFAVFSNRDQIVFFSRLENLVSLAIKRLRLFPIQNCPKLGIEDKDKEVFPFKLSPGSLQSSAVLNIQELEYLPVITDECDQFLLEFLSSFSNLTYFVVPPKIVQERGDGILGFLTRKPKFCAIWMKMFTEWIIANSAKINCDKTLAAVDLKNFLITRGSLRDNFAESYVSFLQISYKETNIIFHSVNSTALQPMWKRWTRLGWTSQKIIENFQFLENVASLHKVTRALQYGYYPMDNLREVSIFHDLSRRQWLHHNPTEISWKSLNTLRICVCLGRKNLTDASKTVWSETFKLLFNNPKRRSVKTLLLQAWSKNISSMEDKEFIAYHEVIFDPSVIAKNFVHLKSLRIDGLQATSSFFEQLLSGLKHLECLKLLSCTKLTDRVFTHLPSNVINLVLDLEKVPLITEDLFCTILPTIPLRRLVIISPRRPLPIRADTLIKMRDGVFGKTIETFPFETWKSKYLKEKEKARFKKYFGI